MRSESFKRFLKSHADKIAVISVVLVWGLAAVFGLLQKFDYRLYDLLLGMRKQPEVRKELMFVEIDNLSLEELGPWPWSRDILANTLLRMKELGASSAVFDIEYLSPSHLGVNPNAAKDIDKAIDGQKLDMADLLTQFADAATSGMYSKKEFNSIADDALREFVYPGLEALKTTISESAYQDNDDIFARAVQFFGNTWLTINILELDIKYSDDYLDYVKDKCLYANVIDAKNRILKGNLFYLEDQGGDNKLGFCPAREQFIRSAQGAGFTNVVLDVDGTRRRVELLSKQGDRYAGQLVFAPILRMLDPESIIRTPFSLKLINAKDPDSDKRINITIPLDSHGRMLINWLKKEFIDSFRRESVVMLYQLDETEKNIVSTLENIGSLELWDAEGRKLSFMDEVAGLINDYNDITSFKNYLLGKCNGLDSNGNTDDGITEEEYADYFSVRSQFFDRVSAFVDGPYFQEILDRLYEMKDDLGNYDEAKQLIEVLYDTLKNEDEIYRSTFNEKKEAYNGSFCIIGNTASSTTDLGTTPFNRSYPNVGTHANVYNTIMTQNFVREIHWFWGFLLASLLAFGVVLYTEGKKVWIQNFAGILSILLAIFVPLLFIVLLQIYIPIVAPVLITVISFLIVVILRFVTAEQDKGVLRNAFSTYLAPTVVEQIVKDPSKLKLGGDEKRMTALFSDIKSFSSFSELVTPTKLVSVLNDYLGSMSDQILAEQGTIDKYIGDSIVSFFGAPIELENSAWNACVSAIRMKQTEEEFNRINVANGNIPRALYTRVGINTGDMVVGNMGTSSKMNYTIMGDAVNLASRLEGVNKVYKSWILCSDSTWQDANSGNYFGKLVGRSFDKVRVVGRDEPVQLWNILGLKDELSDNVLESVEIFKAAMIKYYEKDFEAAGKLFVKANELVPDDESPLVYAQRCKSFIENGIPDNWDGVVNLTSK